jgi:hypothetical protein
MAEVTREEELPVPSLPEYPAWRDCLLRWLCPGLAHLVNYEEGRVSVVDGERHNGHTERSYLL